MKKTDIIVDKHRLLERSWEHLVKAAGECGLKLRQNYNREAPKLALQIGRKAGQKLARGSVG